MGTLRTPASQAIYNEVLKNGVMADGCPLCKKESIKEFTLWRIIENAYPYDRIAKIHHMLLPKRHAAYEELSQEEWDEFESIKENYIHENYEFLIEASHRKKTIPEHWHLHLLVAKD
jgi:hypothetical protein